MENKIIVASEGKIFRRKADGTIIGKEVNLGYVYYMNGKKLDIPHKCTADDFEEVDDNTLGGRE